jgi:two-component system CheB/CheR fusion protein
MLTAGGLNERELGYRLRLMAEQSTAHAIILTDPAGCIVWWNAAAESIFSRRCADVVGTPLVELFTQGDRRLGLADLEQRIAASAASAEDDRWHVKADGSQFWATGALIPLRDASGRLLGYSKVLRDRTELKEQLEHLRSELEHARDIADSRTATMATLSHELRNLVAAVSQGTRMLRKTQDADRQRLLLDMLEQQAVAVHRLTEDLFDASGMLLGKLSIQTQPLSLRELVRQAVTAAQPLVDEKALQLELLTPPNDVQINGDATRLYQVLSNLLGNSIKYTPRAGKIWVKVTVEDAEAVVHVQDSGMGIAPHMLSSIFELFTQADSLTRSEGGADAKGLGVGLALVKEIVALHGGSVQAYSRGIGQGSQFTVRLPYGVAIA